ncbi:hypothetical protein THTE_2300 [Thermogutta terrifontis]|jgi:hypothetical protein|uniref:Uncharacterized protein n=1 Tax=Thermogutta terrifontis TaxID=1331910 RepID=A0A286RG43_9BACT|nr:hypothetical protein [Thermogutta terrifontis]ASV74902.1 hypothetical protein THTE_2300 [Thermogutta terrifontis]
MDWDPKDIPDWQLLECLRPHEGSPKDPFMEELQRRIAAHPELASVWRELQQQDVELARLLQTVPPRLGLEERIISRLGTELRIATPSGSDDATTPDNVQPGWVGDGARALAGDQLHAKRQISRRVWIAAGVSAICASVLGGVGLWLWRRRRRTGPPSPVEIANEVARIFEQTLDEFGTGQPVSSHPPPAHARFSREIRLYLGSTITWRQATVASNRAVVFDITQPSGERGSLFVLTLNLPDFPSFPPYFPQLQTSRTSLGWWRESDIAYLLAVLGGPRVYQRFLKPPSPIT